MHFSPMGIAECLAASIISPCYLFWGHSFLPVFWLWVYTDCLFFWMLWLLIQIPGKHQFSSVQSLSRVRLFATPWTAACQASLSITNSWSLLKLMSIESVMPSNHLILCHLLFFPPSIFPSIRVFSNTTPARLLCPWDSSGKNVGVGCHFLLQGIFLTQGLNPGLLHCRQTLNQLNYKGSPS